MELIKSYQSFGVVLSTDDKSPEGVLGSLDVSVVNQRKKI